jgi:predicted Fe-Mo cluster-binding NifX family protein
MLYKVAIASNDEKYIDRHFGRCESFLIALIDTETEEIRYIESRSVEPLCITGHAEENLEAIREVLADCKYIFVSRVGLSVKMYFKSKGFIILEDSIAIDVALNKLIEHLKIIERSNERL